MVRGCARSSPGNDYTPHGNYPAVSRDSREHQLLLVHDPWIPEAIAHRPDALSLLPDRSVHGVHLDSLSSLPLSLSLSRPLARSLGASGSRLQLRAENPGAKATSQEKGSNLRAAFRSIHTLISHSLSTSFIRAALKQDKYTVLPPLNAIISFCCSIRPISFPFFSHLPSCTLKFFPNFFQAHQIDVNFDATSIYLSPSFHRFYGKIDSIGIGGIFRECTNREPDLFPLLIGDIIENQKMNQEFRFFSTYGMRAQRKKSDGNFSWLFHRFLVCCYRYFVNQHGCNIVQITDKSDLMNKNINSDNSMRLHKDFFFTPSQG